MSLARQQETEPPGPNGGMTGRVRSQDRRSRTGSQPFTRRWQAFTHDGIVHAPLYGPCDEGDFYSALFADTSQANLTLRSVKRGEDQSGQTTVNFWFNSSWRVSATAAFR